MVYEGISTDLPRSFYYNLRKLSGGFSKQQIKVMADRDKCIPSDIATFRFPIGSILNLQSLQFHGKITSTGTNATIMPKYGGSSLIKRMSVSINNVTAQIINDYNLVYNTYADHNYGNLTKRYGEFFDTTTRFTEATPTDANPVQLAGANLLATGTAHLSNERFVINHFLGLLSGGSTPVWSTDMLGEIVVSIQWAEVGVLCGTAKSTAVTYTDNSYEITSMYMLVESYSFSSDEYYNKLNEADKMIGFSDYIVNRFPATTKSVGVNVNCYISASSLDCVIGTALTADGITSVVKPMVGYSVNDTGSTVSNIYKYLADPVASTGNTGSTRASKYGDGFFSSLNLLRDLQFIKTSIFSINNRQIGFAPLDPLEIHQQNLLSLGYENLDLGADGYNPAAVSLKHYFKYYGCCFQDLSLLNPSVFYLSGLNTQGASCALNWTAQFDTGSTQQIFPILITKCSRVLEVGAGRQISVI
jgi:hypothetical protein